MPLLPWACCRMEMPRGRAEKREERERDYGLALPPKPSMVHLEKSISLPHPAQT